MKNVIIILALILGFPLAAYAGDDAVTKVEGCTSISKNDLNRHLIESDVAGFIRKVPESASVRFEVQNCFDDGILIEGKTIVLSSRLSRLSHQMRFFIIAHEYGHYALLHEAKISSLEARNGFHRRDANFPPALSKLSYQNEFEADAFAVRIMHTHGMNAEVVAIWFENLKREGTTTHPAFRERAEAIRAVWKSLLPH